MLAFPQILGAAFSSDVLDDGNNSEVIELATDHFIVVHVVEQQPPRSKDISEVKDVITAHLTQLKASELVSQQASSILAEIESGLSIESIAKDKDYEWQVEQNASRNSAVNRDILSAVFALPTTVNDKLVRKSVTLSNGDAVVIQLEKVVSGDWQELPTAQQRALKTELERNEVSLSLAAFLKSLRDNAEIVSY